MSAAQTPAASAELAELKAKHRLLEERLAALESRPPVAVAAPPETSRGVQLFGAPGKGLTLSMPDGRFSMTIKPRAQIRDTVTAQGDKATTNELNVKTLRLWIIGNVLTKDLTYGIQLAFGGGDFETGSSSPIFDAFVDYSRLRDLNIRVGQFFVPFDRARTIREFGLQLIDRQQVVSELSLDRDIGLMLYSNDLGGFRGILAYNLGIFGGEGKNRFGGAAAGFLYVARIVVRPLGPFDDDIEGDLTRQRRPRLAIGLGGAYNQSTNRIRSTTGNTLTLGTFDYWHGAADVVFKFAGFSFLGELLIRSSNSGVLDGRTGGMDVHEWSRSAYGYLLQAGMMLHDKVEVAARYDELIGLSPENGNDPTLVSLVSATGRELGAGLNVYLNGHAFKLQGDYQYQFGDSVTGGKHLVRIQLDASF